MAIVRNGFTPPAGPNWSSPFRAIYEFKTFIYRSFDGTEVREAMRAIPRISLTYDATMKRALAHRTLGDLAKMQSGAFSVAMEWRSVEIVSVGPSEVTVESVPFWLVVDASIILRSKTGEQVATVIALAGSVVTLDAPILSTVGIIAGSEVLPYNDCRMKGVSSHAAITDDLWSGQFTFDADPGSNIVTFETITVPQVAGIDVLEFPPNWGIAPSLDFTISRRMFDPGIGRIYSDDPVGFHDRTVGVSLGPLTRAEAEFVLAFFNKQRGKRGEFYWDTTLSDAELAASSPVGSTTLTVLGGDFFRNYEVGHRLYNRLLVENAAGETESRQITGITTDGNGDTVVTLDAPSTIAAQANSRVSWFHKWRWATDILEVRWVTDDIAQIDTTFQVVPEIGV